MCRNSISFLKTSTNSTIPLFPTLNAPFNDNQSIQVKNDTTTNKKTSGNQVKSPIIGTAYLAPEPGGKKFTEVGKKIKKGDTVMIVEAMKTMNHVPSPFDGVVKEICVEDGSPVEFDQIIAIVS